MSIQDLHNNHSPPPDSDEILRSLKFRARHAGDIELLAEFFEYVWFYTNGFLEYAYSELDGTLVLSFYAPKNLPTQYDEEFTRELDTWPGLEQVKDEAEDKEDGTCQSEH